MWTLTKNISRTVSACSKSSLQKLQNKVHGVVDGESPDEADESEVEDADDQRDPPAEAIGDITGDGQHQ